VSRAWVLSTVTGVVTMSIKAIGALVPSGAEHSRVDNVLEKLTPLLLPGVLTSLIVVQTFSAERRLTLDARAVGVMVAIIAVRFRAAPAITLTSAALATAVARLIYSHLTGTTA